MSGSGREEWVLLVQRLRSEPGRERDSLDSLQRFIYPVEDLFYQDVDILLTTLLTTPTLHSPELVTKWSQLVHSLVVVQRVAPPQNVAKRLLDLLLSMIPTSPNPSESFYALSSLVRHAAITPKEGERLLSQGGLLASYALSSKKIVVQRAALDCTVSICQHVDVSPIVLNGLMESLLQLLNASIVTASSTSPVVKGEDDLLQIKLQLSILRVFHQMLLRMTSLQPLPLLPSLLATLKVAMTTGLSGHQIPRTLSPVCPHPNVVAVSNSYQATSVAGPRQKKTRRKGRTTQENSDSTPSDSTPSDSTPSDSTPSGSSPSDFALHSDTEDKSSERKERRSKFGKPLSGSESDMSDSDVTVGNRKEVNVKIRVKALSCLNVVFQSLERQSAFSYGLSFLPDAPRSPTAPPSLLTCLCKDHSHKCRSAATSVLMSIIDHSRSFFAVANDQPIASRPFTPYSTLLGGVVKELHRSLFLAITAEPHPTSLTLIIKCLSVLISNVPYQQLSGQYITKILATLQPIATKQETDVAVGCLTCYGALLSLSSTHREMEVWLKAGPVADWPWIVQHCIQLIANQATNQSLMMEALQVLTAIIKFYFPVVRTRWVQLSEVYFDHLSEQPEPLQIHALKFLDELGKTLITHLEENQDQLPNIVNLWERLLSKPLLRWLQEGNTHPLSCAQSCSVVSTLGDQVMRNLQTPTRVLVLTLILGLSIDENSSIKSSALRTLGIFSRYTSLSEDNVLLLDINDRLTRGLVPKELVTVRIQASWAVGNMTDSFVHDPCRKDVIALLFPSLAKCVVTAMEDIEKVKVNAVRAAGNLLHCMSEEIFEGCGSHVTSMCSLLSKSINAGIMKTRWNTCYACYNAFSNPVFLQLCNDAKVPMVEELCKAVISCKNFKVRTNAALALGSSISRHSTTQSALEKVWISILKAIENSDYHEDFTEYRQTSSLRVQLCQVFCQLISLMEDETIFINWSPSLTVIKLLEQPAQEMLASSTGSSDKNTFIQEAKEKLKQFEEHPSSRLPEEIISSLVTCLQLKEIESETQ